MTNNTSEQDLKALMQLVGKNDDNIMSAKLLIDNSKHLHWWAIFEFWKLLFEKFVDLGFIIRRRIENEVIDDLVHGSAAKKNKTDFNLKLTTPDGLNFTINADHDNYICVGVMSDDIAYGLKSKAKAFYKTMQRSLALEDCDNWQFYKFIDFQNSEGLYLGDFSDELTFNLISESCRNEIVSCIITQSKNLLKCYKKYLN